ncbi:gas vesicle protein GvpJ [Streptomyces sp. MP131-18]|uniref:gas vesicle protein GvpJ n=1 Tax=Streptomyces sp. MP131-18 TaxID=1857892 RepID=UPI0009CC2C48|nr:gas vesicle protein GvpJ [Streptomyces sp. MP131-18]ONK11158.1 Gas vesicle structural protein [Streptomyces sp. MP131-18]
MTVTPTYRDDVACVPRAGTLYDVVDIILDRGMVIDIFVRVSLVGIEILKIDVRVVIASIDTYLRFAEVCDSLCSEEDPHSRRLGDLIGGGGPARAAVGGSLKKATQSVGRKAKNVLTGGEDDDGRGRGRSEDEGRGNDRGVRRSGGGAGGGKGGKRHGGSARHGGDEG